MELNIINPYLRYVRTLNYKPRKEYLCAVDYHFYFMLSTFCVLKIADTDYVLRNGTAVIIPPGTRYRFDTQKEFNIISINFDYTQNFSHLVKEVHPINSETFSQSSIIEKVTFENYPFMNEPIVVENMSYLSDTLNSIISEFTYKRQLYIDISSSLFKNVLINIVRNISYSGKASDSINEILNYIHTHYSEDIDNETLAGILGYHPYHLNRIMKKATGTTLRQYLINYRIDAAKHYLRDTSHQISEISELCGYKNFSNFSYEFKRKTDLSPSAYRLNTQHLL